jgi:hypothetical protein
MKLMPTCKEVSELLSQGQDRPLTGWEKFGTRFHLLLCEGCRRFSDHLDILRTTIRRYIDGNPR